MNFPPGARVKARCVCGFVLEAVGLEVELRAEDHLQSAEHAAAMSAIQQQQSLPAVVLDWPAPPHRTVGA